MAHLMPTSHLQVHPLTFSRNKKLWTTRNSVAKSVSDHSKKSKTLIQNIKQARFKSTKITALTTKVSVMATAVDTHNTMLSCSYWPRSTILSINLCTKQSCSRKCSSNARQDFFIILIRIWKRRYHLSSWIKTATSSTQISKWLSSSFFRAEVARRSILTQCRVSHPRSRTKLSRPGHCKKQDKAKKDPSD